jgi:ABC-type bacteriocin/lantibiotic exporter with double-glycine peptidase domain
MDKSMTAKPLFLLCALVLASGCYRGGARPLEASAITGNQDWIAVPGVLAVRQAGEHDCGAAAAAMVLSYWGMPTGQAEVRAASNLPGDQPLTAGFLKAYLHSRGLTVYLIAGKLEDLERELRAGHPVLVGVVKPYLTTAYAHYQVVVGLNPQAKELAVIDPADGWREYSYDSFAREWAGAKELTLVAIGPAGGALAR